MSDNRIVSKYFGGVILRHRCSPPSPPLKRGKRRKRAVKLIHSDDSNSDDDAELQETAPTPNNSCVGCAICLSQPLTMPATLLTQQGGEEACKHRFCAECLVQWASCATTCPLCKVRFSCAKWIDENGQWCEQQFKHTLQRVEDTETEFFEWQGEEEELPESVEGYELDGFVVDDVVEESESDCESEDAVLGYASSNEDAMGSESEECNLFPTQSDDGHSGENETLANSRAELTTCRSLDTEHTATKTTSNQPVVTSRHFDRFRLKRA